TKESLTFSLDRAAEAHAASEFPFPVRWLHDGRFSPALRDPGRGAFQWDSECRATAGSAAAPRGFRRARCEGNPRTCGQGRCAQRIKLWRRLTNGARVPMDRG